MSFPPLLIIQLLCTFFFFFFKNPAPTEISPLPLPAALPFSPAALTPAPFSAGLPRRTARPPSFVSACSTSRMQPPAASVSKEDQRFDVENASVVRTPPGAAWNSSRATEEGDEARMSQAESHDSRSSEWTDRTSVFSSPPRYSSPRIA